MADADLSLPPEPEPLQAIEHRLLVRIMAFRAVVLVVGLLFAWDADLERLVFSILAMLGALLVGQLLYRSQLAWARRSHRQQELRRRKAEEVAREAAARAAEEASRVSYFDWEGEEGGETPPDAASATPANPAATAPQPQPQES